MSSRRPSKSRSCRTSTKPKRSTRSPCATRWPRSSIQSSSTKCSWLRRSGPARGASSTPSRRMHCPPAGQRRRPCGSRTRAARVPRPKGSDTLLDASQCTQSSRLRWDGAGNCVRSQGVRSVVTEGPSYHRRPLYSRHGPDEGQTPRPSNPQAYRACSRFAPYHGQSRCRRTRWVWGPSWPRALPWQLSWLVGRRLVALASVVLALGVARCVWGCTEGFVCDARPQPMY
mmetsp:Transcript_99796/g.171973  ORF Transcript_99796/g.171973 Transcript_99796/m.171973 type:complete len:229 (-) Transcript_99796:255-941(-)